MKQFTHYSKVFLTVGILFLMTSCGSSVTNVWDYYVTNEVVVHKSGENSIFKKKLLFRDQERVNKSQLELIAVKQDNDAYLVIGSHKVAKSFMIKDSIYAFDVTDLYSRVRGNDFIRQMGDLNIYFTHVPVAKVNEFLANYELLKKQFADATVAKGATTQIDFYLGYNVFVSFEKTKMGQTLPSSCTIWVGKRKHNLATQELVRVLTEAKNFN
ncbi:MAG: hypothetical protein V4651_14450 [Bacteroidota bacterium]